MQHCSTWFRLQCMAAVMDTLPSATIFFNCTSRALIDIWINFLKSFTVYWRNIFAWMSYVIKKVLGDVEIKVKKRSQTVVEISCDVTECIFCMCMCRLMGFIGTAEEINMNSWTSTDVTDFTRDVTKIVIYRYDSDSCSSKLLMFFFNLFYLFGFCFCFVF